LAGGSVGNGEAGIAAGGGHHPGGGQHALLGGGQDAVERAAHLEGPRVLELLEFQPHPGRGRECPLVGLDQRGNPDPPGDAGGGGAYIGTGDHDREPAIR
jgi:hypothetical protein